MLPEDVLCAIYAHARGGYPREVCGLVFCGTGDGYPDAEARPSDGRHNTRTSYRLADPDLLLLARSLSSDRPARIVYHSHVDAAAHFSDDDARAALVEGRPLYPVDHLVVDVR